MRGARRFLEGHALRHKACVLLLKCLSNAIAPAVGDRSGHGVGEDILFTVFQSIEDALRDGLRRSLRDVEAARHVGVDGTQEHAVDRDSLTCQQRALRACVMLSAAAFEIA